MATSAPARVASYHPASTTQASSRLGHPSCRSAPRIPERAILDYFRTDWLHVPAEWEPAANELLQILHERNWMVCPRGPDHYGFVHRQFMEHLVASALLARRAIQC